MKRLADRRDYFFRLRAGRIVRVSHASVMAAGGPQHYECDLVSHWWRDGDREVDPRLFFVAKIAFETLKRRMQPQAELEL